MKGKDLTGQRFGKLLVLKLDEDFEAIRGSRQRRWICQCDCGVIKSIIGAELTRTKKPQRSCGCAAHERSKNFGKLTFKDLSGQKFGLLTPIEKIGTNNYGYAIWHCICNCGKEINVTSRELLSGDTISCGCQKNGYRENYIAELLKQKNISYIREYSFKDLKDTIPLRFDYAIFKNGKLDCLIEHQGEQHTNRQTNWHTEKLVLHDKMKKEYCYQNNIPLYEIQYFDNLEQKLNKILIERSCLSSDQTMDFM